MAKFNLSKNSSFNLTKNGSIKRVRVKMQWVKNVIAGQEVDDLDLAIFGLNSGVVDGANKDYIYSDPFTVFYANESIQKNILIEGKKYTTFVAPDESITHLGDVRDSDKGDNNIGEEIAIIDLGKLPKDMKKIALICSAYDDFANKGKPTYYQYAKLFNYKVAKVEVYNEDNSTLLFEYVFSESEDYKNTTSVIFGFFEQENNEWVFKASAVKDDEVKAKKNLNNDDKGVEFFLNQLSL